MPRLTQTERNRAIGMADIEASQQQIARTFNCSQATISNLHKQNATELSVWPIWGLSDCQNLQLQSSHHHKRTQADRNRANGMANMAASQRQIARTFNCSQATISNLHRQNATELTVWPIWRPLNGRLQEPSTAVKRPSASYTGRTQQS